MKKDSDFVLLFLSKTFLGLVTITTRAVKTEEERAGTAARRLADTQPLHAAPDGFAESGRGVGRGELQHINNIWIQLEHNLKLRNNI